MSRIGRMVLLGSAVMALVGTTVPLAAQTAAPPTRIGFVNARAVLAGMPGYAQAESLFVQERDRAQAELTSLRQVFDSAVAEFEQQQAILSPSSRAAKRQQLEQQQQRLEQRTQQLSEEMERKQTELLDPMQRRLTAVIDGLRAEGNYAFIFDMGTLGPAIISADQTLDITSRVIERLRQSN